MAKLYTGNINFSVGIKQKGAVPLDDRTVVETFNDLLNSETFGLSAYEGMLVAVMETQKVYMLVDKNNSTSEESWVVVGNNDTKNTAGSSESKEKLYLIGAPEQTESGTTTYSNSNIYVSGETLYVKDDNVLVFSDITGLTESINTLKGIVGTPAISETEATGLVKEVADLKADVEAIEIPEVPEVPVQDVTVNGVSVLNENGIAEIVMPEVPEIPEVPVQDVTVGGVSVLNENGIAEIIIPEVPEIPEVPVQDVTVDGVSVLNKETGVAEIVMPDVTVYETIENVNKVRKDVSANTESINEISASVSANTESINTLESDISTLKGIVGAPASGETEATGLVKEVADLKADVEAIEIPEVPEVPVQDVTVDGVSVLNKETGVAVINLTTDDTYVSENITIAGGPLAELAKQVYTGGTVPQGISIQEFFRNLLCQKIYPITVSSGGSYSISLNSTPSISANVNSGSLQEIGTKVNFNAVTAVMVSENKTNPKVTGFEYGYSDTINGAIIKGPTSVTTTISSSQKSGEVYKLSASKKGFSGSIQENASNAIYSSCKLSATTLTVVLGTNSYTVTETPPKYTYSYSGIDSKYIVSNLGDRSEDKKSEAVAAKTATDSNQPTTSTTFTVTGVYPVYTNISNGAFTDNATTKMNLQTSATFTFENVPGEVGSNPFMFDFPSDKSVSSFQMKNPSGEWVSFSSDYTTDTTVTKTINGTSYTYKRLKTDGTQGAGNTYKVVLNTALNA